MRDFFHLDQPVPNWSSESLSIGIFDTDGEGAPLLNGEFGPCNDSPSSEAMSSPDVPSSYASLVLNRCTSFAMVTIELLVEALARSNEEGVVVVVIDPGLIVRPRETECTVRACRRKLFE